MDTPGVDSWCENVLVRLDVASWRGEARRPERRALDQPSTHYWLRASVTVTVGGGVKGGSLSGSGRTDHSVTPRYSLPR